MFPTTAAILGLVLYAGITWVIVKNYRHTHNLGFLFLGGGVLVWPLVGNLLSKEMPTAIRLGYFPFSLVTSGQITLGELVVNFAYADRAIHAALILIGLVMIGRAINRTHTVSTGN